MSARLRALAEKANRPAPPLRREEPGTVVLPPEIHAALRNGEGLAAVDVLLLTVVLAQLQAGPLTRYARVEDGTLVVSTAHGVLAGLDPDADVSHRDRALRWLSEAGYLTVARTGAETRIALGPLLVTAFGRREKP